jgi:hypothetical protein
MAGLKLTPIILKEVNKYLTSPKKVRKFGFDQPPVKTGKDIKRPENPFREFEERNPQADGGRIKLQGGTDIKTRQGFQPGNPGNPQSLRELNISRKSGQDSRVTKFKELVKSGSTPNEAKKTVIEQFKLDRNPKAGTPTWMTKGKEQLIAEGFDYQASARGPKNVGGVEKAAQKRKQVIGEGRKFEERVKRTKQKTGFGKKFELAHTANIFQAKKLGIVYPIDALAIQATEINQVVAEKLNDELKPKYSKQLKLVNKMKRKNTPSLQKQLDKINFEISELVATGGKQGSKAANVLKPIIVDPITLKGNILDLGFDTSTELMASPKTTTKATKAGSPDDLMARLNIGRQAFKSVPTPLGAVGLTAGFGVDPTSAIDRASIAAEAAFAPALVKQSAKMGAAQRLFNLGLTPKLAMRAARIASPLGIASLGAEGLYQAGKFTKKRIGELKAMSPEQRRALRAKQAAFAFEGAREGGIIGKKSGPPPVSGPTPHGDEGLPAGFKRVKKQ